MPSQWLALPAGVDSRARARQLRQSWERLLAVREPRPDSGPDPAGGLRQPIVESWQRSLDTGLDPLDLLAPLEVHPVETQERWAEHPLGSLAHVLLAQLGDVARDSQSLIVVGDASGLLLHIEGSSSLRARAAEMNFVEGARYSETAAGTNGIGTVLAADHALQVFASEHFNQRHHGWTCSGAPVHDPVSRRVLGVVDLSSPWEKVGALSLELATAAAHALEQCLADARRHSDGRLRRRYADLATRTTDLLVSPDGYVLAGERSSKPPKPLTIPEGGGEIVLSDGSRAAAEPLGHGEAYLVRRIGPSAVAAAPTKAPGRAHDDADEEVTRPPSSSNVGRGRLGAEPDRRAVSAYFEAALDCVIIADASGRVVEFNPAAERTFGYSRDEALGRTMAELIVPPSLRERHSSAFARFVETGRGTVLGRRLELTGMRADGSEFPVELALSQIEGEPLLICGALRDISAAKQAERHLRELADEQAALRRVATLVARESSPQQLFATVAEQVARLIDVPLVRLVRYESDGSAVELIGGWGESVDPLSLGTRWQLDGPGALASVWRSRLPARLDDHTDVPGQAALVVRQAGMRSAVASPITVEGRLWGAIAVLSPRREPLPEGTEARLADFTELIVTAISNSEARDGERRLAEEQAALRRVAELVAREASQVEVFATVADAVSGLLGEEVRMVRYEATDAVVVAGSVGPLEHVFRVGSRVPLGGNNAVSRVFRTGKPVRIDDYREASGPIADTVSPTGLRSVVATPIVVEGRLWGTMVVAAFRDEPIAPRTESRLAQFTELVATALANAESRAELAGSEARARKLAEEQAALRRIATLVARESSPDEIFAVVAEEVGRVVNVPLVALARYEPDGSAIHLVGAWSEGALPVPIGGRHLLDGPSGFLSVWQTRKPARTGDSTDVPGQIAAARRQAGLKSSVASPILVEGRLWGVISVASSEPLPEDTDVRLLDFTELVATSIATSEARDSLRQLVDEQAALRRVATLVAEGAAASTLFSAVTEEVAMLFEPAAVTLDRYDGDVSTVVAASGIAFPVGSRWSLDVDSLAARVYAAGRPVHVANYTDIAGATPQEMWEGHPSQSDLGVPIVVDGSLWGVLCVATPELDRNPSEAAERIGDFTELVATAIANGESRAELAASETHARQLAAEQAALRRVATLVAHESSADDLFAAVAEEVGRVLSLPVTALIRYEPDGSAMEIVGGWSETTFPVPIGTRLLVDGPSVVASVWQTGRPARTDDVIDVPGEVAAALRQAGLRSNIASPILVDGRLWGVMGAGSPERLPEGIESRLMEFTELVATAIANSDARDDLRRLVDEQAALRRVATLVAESASADEVFSSVAREVAHVFGVSLVTVCRYESDAVVVLASLGAPRFSVGSSWPLDVPSLPATIFETGRPARIDDYSAAVGLDAIARDGGVRASVGVPIVVDSTVWGCVNVATPEEPFPADAEERLARFTELVATAVSNATMRAEVAASRARVIAAGDETRRRIERDLHDGAQQQLVTLALELRSTEGRVPAGLDTIRREIGRSADRLTNVIEELREMSRGIHPAILTEGGLAPAVEALALRSPVPVRLDVSSERRLPDAIEVAAYYVVSEALTNTAKHAEASRVEIDLQIEDETLSLTVVDDGVGGARLSGGSGLIGLKDRVEALGGTINVESPPGGGTRLDVDIPLLADPSVASPEQLSPA